MLCMRGLGKDESNRSISVTTNKCLPWLSPLKKSKPHQWWVHKCQSPSRGGFLSVLKWEEKEVAEPRTSPNSCWAIGCCRNKSKSVMGNVKLSFGNHSLWIIQSLTFTSNNHSNHPHTRFSLLLSFKLSLIIGINLSHRYLILIPCWGRGQPFDKAQPTAGLWAPEGLLLPSLVGKGHPSHKCTSSISQNLSRGRAAQNHGMVWLGKGPGRSSCSKPPVVGRDIFHWTTLLESHPALPSGMGQHTCLHPITAQPGRSYCYHLSPSPRWNFLQITTAVLNTCKASQDVQGSPSRLFFRKPVLKHQTRLVSSPSLRVLITPSKQDPTRHLPQLTSFI